MKKTFLILSATFILYGSSINLNAQNYNLKSPDGRIQLQINLEKYLTYSIYFDGREVMKNCKAYMILNDEPSPGVEPEILKTTQRAVNEIIISPVPFKRKNIPDNFNETTIVCKGNYSVVFRAYNDGVAYRFVTNFSKDIVVNKEIEEFNFVKDDSVYFPEVADYQSSFEAQYKPKKLSELTSKDMAYIPLLVNIESGPNIAFAESDLWNYPGMFLRGNPDIKYSLKSDFASYPKNTKIIGDTYKSEQVDEREDYIARTIGKRNFPWRIIIIAAEDKDLPLNDLVYRLSPPCEIKDVSWIEAGNAIDDWIVSRNIYRVDFKSGFNNETYKYYIDFCSTFGIKFFLVDAGWSNVDDMFKITQGIDMDIIARYSKEKNVGLIMWTLALTLDRQMDSILPVFNKWGAKGFMTDFMDRDDQLTVDFYYRVAKTAAEKKLMVMFHGAYKPTGMERQFPNLIGRENTLGSEYNIWSDKATPEHNLNLAFIRMLAGPLDYEPIVIQNATKESFRAIEKQPMSQGTRVGDMAKLIIYESPLQVLAGSPSDFMREPDLTSFIAKIPTTWDDIYVSNALLGKYLTVARKKGNEWYVGSVTDWTPRSFDLKLDFLDEGIYTVDVWSDGINADKYAGDYKHTVITAKANDILKLNLAPGGGWVAHFVKKG
jgi:alpha-glucosidase